MSHYGKERKITKLLNYEEKSKRKVNIFLGLGWPFVLSTQIKEVGFEDL